MPCLRRWLFNVILLTAASTAVANERTILAEFSTNASCIPCVDGTKALDAALMVLGRDHIAVVRYHTPAPTSLDPFYQSNKEECDYRANTYGLQSNPVLLIDGVNAGPTDSLWKDSLAAALQRTATISLGMQGTFSARSGTVLISFTALPSGGELLYGVITEGGIEFEGLNREQIHDDVFQHTVTGWSGVRIDSLTQQLSFTLGIDTSNAPPFIHQWDPDSCRVIVWLQNPNTLAVSQSAQIRVSELQTSVPDIALPQTAALRVFPNPANAYVELAVDQHANADQVLILDLLGNIVFTAQGTSIPMHMSLSRLPIGAYRVMLLQHGRVVASAPVVRY